MEIMDKIGVAFLLMCTAIGVAGLICLLIGFPIMWLWNAIAVTMFGAPVITFWKAVGLSFLIRMLYPTAIKTSK